MQIRRIIFQALKAAMLSAAPALALRTPLSSIQRALHDPMQGCSFTLPDQTTASSDPTLIPTTLHNALLGAKLRAPFEAESIRYVGTGLFDYPTVESAITNMAAVIGTNTWVVPEIIVIRPYVYTNDITLGDAVTNLNPTAGAPLIIRGGIDSRTILKLKGHTNDRFFDCN
jgi:hypothetical protein